MSGDLVAQSDPHLGADGHELPTTEQIESVAIGRVCIDGAFVVPLTPEQADRRFVIHAQQVASRINSESETVRTVGFGVGRGRPKANPK